MSNIDKLKDLNRRLTAALDDPQPGLISWRGLLADICDEIAKYGRGK